MKLECLKGKKLTEREKVHKYLQNRVFNLSQISTPLIFFSAVNGPFFYSAKIKTLYLGKGRFSGYS